MRLNPLHFLFETKRHPNARTLRTNFREKLLDAFRTLTGFIEFNTPFEEEADSFLTLSAIRYDFDIEHKSHRTLGIFDYLTLGLFLTAEELFTFIVDAMHTAKTKLTISALGPWYWRWIPKLLLYPVMAVSWISRVILFLDVAIRYLVSAAIVLLAMLIIGLIAIISNKLSRKIKEKAFTVKSYNQSYETLAQFDDFIQHQDITPTFDTELRLSDDIHVFVIDANAKMDIESVQRLISDREITPPTLILVKATYPNLDENNCYQGDPIKIRPIEGLDKLQIVTANAFFDQYNGYFLLMNEQQDIAKLYYYQYGLQEEPSFICRIKPDSANYDLLREFRKFGKNLPYETALTSELVNQWIVANPSNAKRTVHVPYLETYQCFVVGNKQEGLTELKELEGSSDIEADYRLFVKRLQSTACVSNPKIIFETKLPYRLDKDNNHTYHQVNWYFSKYHAHKKLHLGVRASVPFSPEKPITQEQRQKYSFFGTIKTREELDNLEAINFADIDLMEVEERLTLPF